MSKYYFIDKYKINVYKYIDGKLHWLNYQGIWVLYSGYFGYKDINRLSLKIGIILTQTIIFIPGSKC